MKRDGEVGAGESRGAEAQELARARREGARFAGDGLAGGFDVAAVSGTRRDGPLTRIVMQ